MLLRSKKNIFFRRNIWFSIIIVCVLPLLFFFSQKYPLNQNTLVPSFSTLYSEAQVTKVIDGDTIDVLIDGKEERVRLIGIDASEVEHEGKPGECFGKEAKMYLEGLLNGQTVQLQSDPTQSKRDEYNRLLRYVFLPPEERLVNSIMLSQGFAREYTFKGIPHRYQKEFQDAQRRAEQQKIGLFADGVCD